MGQSQLKQFIDIEFPPTTSSIHASDEKFPFKEPIVWKRAKDFLCVGNQTPKIFEKNIEPGDIKQGQLGDCWFMSALACLAENPELVQRLFVTKTYQHDGCYRLRLCKNGIWVNVTIDDYFPCSVKGGPIFSRAHGNEMWVLLLEKAYAKLHGNYYTLRGGFASEGFSDLTGNPTECYDFEDPIASSMID